MQTVAGDGDTVLVSRNSHKSLIGALIVAGVRRVFLEPEYDTKWDVGHGSSHGGARPPSAARPALRLG